MTTASLSNGHHFFAALDRQIALHEVPNVRSNDEPRFIGRLMSVEEEHDPLRFDTAGRPGHVISPVSSPPRGIHPFVAQSLQERKDSMSSASAWGATPKAPPGPTNAPLHNDSHSRTDAGRMRPVRSSNEESSERDPPLRVLTLCSIQTCGSARRSITSSRAPRPGSLLGASWPLDVTWAVSRPTVPSRP